MFQEIRDYGTAKTYLRERLLTILLPTPQ